jgi:transcription elongation factor GreA
MNNRRFRVTKAGYDRLQAELNKLINVERPAISKAIGDAIALGDLSENQEYSSSKDRQSLIETMITKLNKRLSNAEIIDAKKCSGESIDFGAIVYLIDEDTGKEIYYQILSEYEANLEKRIISIESPIGMALIGKEVGEVVEVKVPSGVKIYEIIKIEWGRIL